jgi:nicotinamidase/pyrazinamidase
MEGVLGAIRAAPGRKALLVIDLQNDFLPGGPMAVPDGDAVIPIINELANNASLWSGVVASKDWHPANHVSFHSNHEDAVPFTLKHIPELAIDQMMWNPHCIADSKGSELSKDSKLPKDAVIILKGRHREVDSYSAFGDGIDKTREKTELETLLKEWNIDHVYVCGLATDYCVAFTAMDAVKAGFQASVILSASRGIAKETVGEALEKMAGMGVELLE